MNAMNVEKLLVRALILFNIKESILGRNLTSVANVKKLLVIGHPLGKNIMQYKCEQRKQTGKLQKKHKWPKQMKRFSTSLFIMGTQIKMRPHFSDIRLAKVLKYR